ncbi:MAG: DUF362 domain-containing protein [Candidatus Helarchaeota archaeon]|nr:DUF362 domain-containing protein [Candidatus Helarchaeota archaeon]
MSNKSIVYWASPNEMFALFHSAKDMTTNNLVKTRYILDKILDNINSGDKVAVKVHVGEANNTHYLRHDYIREVVNAIKSKGGIPALIETQGLGLKINVVEISEDYSIHLGHRKNATDHSKIAHLHGYSEAITGAPLEFIDGDKGLDGKNIQINGIHHKTVSVGAGLFKFDKLVVVSHFKGHGAAAFGGALKQIGQGCVTKKYKHLAHFNRVMKINPKRCNISKCNQECIKVCPTNAIKIDGDSAVIDVSNCFGCFLCTRKCPVKRAMKEPLMNNLKDFTERVIDNATAVISSFKPENIRYINFAFDVTVQCDCVSSSGMPVVPDLGIFGSSDPVAVDKACLDAEVNAPGLPIFKNGQWTEPLPPGVEKFKEMLGSVDSKYQFDSAVKNKIGTTEYELIKQERIRTPSPTRINSYVH